MHSNKNNIKSFKIYEKTVKNSFVAKVFLRLFAIEPHGLALRVQDDTRSRMVRGCMRRDTLRVSVSARYTPGQFPWQNVSTIIWVRRG